MISVLYVDDEPGLLELGSIFLERQKGLTVRTASSAKEALRLLAHTDFEAVISDYQMPEMDGIEFLKKVRERHPDLPFILFTGKGREEVVIEAINNGADFYLQKGGSPEAQFAELGHKIRQAVTRCRAERNLKKKTDELDRFFSLSLDLLCISSMEGVFLRVNPTWEHVLGYETKDLEGKRFMDFVHPDDVGKTIAAMAELADDKEVLNFVNRYRTKDGRYRWIEWRSMPFGGKLIYAAARDITKRKQVEEELMRSEQMLKIVINNFPGVVFWKDKDLAYIGGNIESAKLAGFNDPSEFVGKTDREMKWRQKVADDFNTDDRRVMESGQPKVHVIEKFQKDDGTVSWLDSSKIPLRDPNGQIIGLLGIISDITEVKKVEEDLRQENLVVENSPAVLFRWEAQNPWRVLLVSNNVTQFGYAPSEFLSEGLEFAKIMHPDDVERTDLEVRQELQRGSDHFRLRYRIFTKSGDVRWVREYSVVEKDAEGNPAFLQGVLLDLTDQVQVEETLIQKNAELNEAYQTLSKIEKELRTSELRNRRLLERSFDAVITHRAGKIISVNEAAIKMMGAESADDIIGHPLVEFASPDSKDLIMDRTQTLYSKIDLVVPLIEERFRRVDGEIIDVEVMATSYLEDDMPTVLVVFRDVTQQHIINRELRASEQKYQELFELSGEAILLAENKTGQILECNTAASEMYGYERDELLKMHSADLASEPDIMGQATEEGKILIPLRYDRRKDGSIFPVEISGRYFTWKGKNVHVLAIRDITDRQLIEDSLRITNKKMQLLGSITRHDILNKVTAMQGYLELARIRNSDPKMTEFFDRIEKTTESVREHIEFSRIYQGLGQYEPEWLSLNGIIDSLDVPSGLTLKRDIGNVEIFADPMLEKVFDNLLDNTIRHGEKCTIVTVVTEKIGKGLKIIWNDDGIGISPTEKELIFERGYGRNTGLGLFISREILAITGITIKETGYEGKGANFEIEVPLNGYREFRS